MDVIARIYTDFTAKFGVPRQSGLTPLQSKIIFEPRYGDPCCVRGLGDYSHIWLIWGFCENPEGKWSPTVRPPRLGGNRRVGVFATRSPFRPNSLGLSSVKLVGISRENGTSVLTVEGADMTSGTPIFDVKPYIPYTDSHPDARGGFAEDVRSYSLEVVFPSGLLSLMPDEKRSGLLELLSEDPRPSYQEDPERRYGFDFAGFEISFSVKDALLTVLSVTKK